MQKKIQFNRQWRHFVAGQIVNTIATGVAAELVRKGIAVWVERKQKRRRK